MRSSADDHLWGVVLAGGIGSRFWPASTPSRPKQLLPLASDRPLIADTIDRVEPLIPIERLRILTGEHLAKAIGGAALDVFEVEPLPADHALWDFPNVIITPQGTPRAIDWATTGTRSPLYDLYYLVMNHCVRVMPPIERRDRFGQMLAAVRERLGAKSPAKLAASSEAVREAAASLGVPTVVVLGPTLEN